MATKRSLLPKVTPEDVTSQPQRLRPTPKGGWAWKCHYCGEFASSETQKGLYVCRRHGGVTPKQRDPLLRARAEQMGETVRPPGRPISHGRYSQSQRLTVDEIVQEYEEHQVDVDDITEDLLYLRAHHERARLNFRGSHEDTVDELLGDLTDRAWQLTDYIDGQTADTLTYPDHLFFKISNFHQLLQISHQQYQDFITAVQELEARHERFIKLARSQADLALKTAMPEQVHAFTLTLQQVLSVLHHRLPEDKLVLVRERFSHEFRELPSRVLAGNTVTVTPKREANVYLADAHESRLGSMALRCKEEGMTLEDTRKDLLYLRAHVRKLINLSTVVEGAHAALNGLEDSLERFLGRHHDSLTLRDRHLGTRTLKIINDLQQDLKDAVGQLAGFDAELEERHHRIIRMTQLRADIKAKVQASKKIMLYQHLVQRLEGLLNDLVAVEDVQYLQHHLLSSPRHEQEMEYPALLTPELQPSLR